MKLPKFDPQEEKSLSVGIDLEWKSFTEHTDLYFQIPHICFATFDMPNIANYEPEGSLRSFSTTRDSVQNGWTI